MIEGRNRARFLLESGAVAALETLDGDYPIQPRVPRLPYFAHPARPDSRQDLVRAEFVTGG